MVKALTRSAARVYGALTALGEGSTDVIERLLPFLEPILRSKQGMRLDLVEIARDVRETYKWNFNTDIVEVFVPRLVDAGWLIPDNPGIDQTSYTISLPDQIQDPEKEASVQRELRSLAEKFKSFAESLSPLTAIPLDVDEFEDILIEWLIYVEAFSEENLDFRTEIREDETGTLRQVVDVQDTTSLRDEEKFLCARFVQYAIETDQNASEILARIASIGLLTEVVQDFVKPNTPVEKSNLVVYLDGPVALELLGTSGRAARENIHPIVSELQRIGVTVRIFGQSLDEIKRSLQAVLQNPRPTGPTAQALARGDVLKEYVIEVSRDPEPFLQELGIRVAYRTLDQTPSEHAFFSEDQRTEMFGYLSFQNNVQAREHDADVTTLVMRQRKGQEDRDIFKSRFLLLTKNGLLAQITRKRCVRTGALSPNAVPPIVHRRVMAAAMWLRTGLGAENFEVPKRMLLATCENVLAIRPGVVDAVKRITDSLGDEEKARQLNLLVMQDRSAQMLMDKTLGAASVVTEENLPELFEEMLHPHLEDERKRTQEAVKEERVKGRRKLAKANEELKSAKAAEGLATAELERSFREDRKAVQSLCRDVESRLAQERSLRIAVGLLLAVLFCLPPFFLPSAWEAYLTILLSVPLAFLTLTGSRLLGTATSSEKAFAKLEQIAGLRSLSTKVARFKVDWDGKHFSMTDKKNLRDGDLIARAGAGQIAGTARE